MSAASTQSSTVPTTAITRPTTLPGGPSTTSRIPSSIPVLTSTNLASETRTATSLATKTTTPTSAFTTPDATIISISTTSSGFNSNTGTTPSTNVAPTSAEPSTTSVAPTASTVQSTTSVSTTSSISAISIISGSLEPSTSTTLPVFTPVIPTSAVVTTSTTRLATPTRITSSSVSRSTVIVTRTSSFLLVPTTSGGLIYTVTVVIGGTPSASSSASASIKKSFFQHTGAVVGVFLVIGIAFTALLLLFGTTLIRRHRANQFDKEVQEAAREAARAQAPTDDDGGASYITHGSHPISIKRPGGYEGHNSTVASSWDPFSRAAAGTGRGYEMQQRRMGTAPAGSIAGSVFARSVGHGQDYAQNSYNTGYEESLAHQTNYSSTSPSQTYALAHPPGQHFGRVPIHAQMMLPEAQRYSYTADAHSGPSNGNVGRGYDNNYRPGYAPRQEQEYSPRQSQDSHGGYEPDDAYTETGPSVSHGYSPNPSAYGGSAGNTRATGDRVGGAAVGRWQSGRSRSTRYSQEEESDEGSPPRRVLKVANE